MSINLDVIDVLKRAVEQRVSKVLFFQNRKMVQKQSWPLFLAIFKEDNRDWLRGKEKIEG